MSERITAGLMQIGDVAARTGLSLRTLRYYEEEGLVAPCERSAGGFRLYSDAECEKLEMIKRMKPLGFSLEEMRELMALLESIADAEPDHPTREKLQPFVAAAEDHCRLLRAQLRDAVRLADQLRAESASDTAVRHAHAG